MAMTTLRWFGGRVEPGDQPVDVPEGARLFNGPQQTIWTVGDWPVAEVRTTATRHRQIAVFGPCAATDRELHELAARGVPDSALTAFAGSYTLVEFTADTTRVFTDPGHAQPIYLARTPTGTVWGSSALALAALTGATPDLAWLAALLLSPDQPRLLAGRSAFTGVDAVPPGSCLVLAPGARPHVRSAWCPARSDAGLVEGAGRVRAALANAVAVRIDFSRRPSSDCSGGLDSTSLTMLAAARLSGRGRLDAVTVHPAGTDHGGDLDYAADALATHPQISYLLCPLGTGHLPYSRLTELVSATDEPAPTTMSIARAVAEFDLLRQVGSDCHLTGDGGDTLLGAHPAYLADLAATGRSIQLLRHAIGWARLRRRPVWPLLTEVAQTVLDWRGGDHGPHRRPWPAWSTSTARALVTDTQTSACSPPLAGRAGTATLVEAIQSVGRTARADAQVAEHYGIAIHNPFIDPQVITAVLAVPAELRAAPFRYKPLLSTALADLLPPAVATRRTKGDFTPDHYLGLRANSAVLHDLADGALAEHGLLDVAQFRQQLRRAQAGLPVAFSEFEPVLAVEVWLRTISASPPAARWAAEPRDQTGQAA